ncbi:MAG: oligosaccharide flippase family protein [Bacteroidetes bacterium]|nr:oligosaccharide flippase family protein [Bacteroidota bacterium]
MNVSAKNNLRQRKFTGDLSANAIQTLATQAFSFAIFYLTSRYLSKTDYGMLNWSMASAGTILAISSLGTDFILVKRIATGKSVQHISSIHLFHTLTASSVICFIVGLIAWLRPDSGAGDIFFYVTVLLSIGNIANSFKLMLNGLEAYRKMAWLALFSNLIRFMAIVALYISGHFTLYAVIGAYTLGACAELLLGHWITNRVMKTNILPKLYLQEYKGLLKESLPQLAIVVFDSALARIDWILLGLVSTSLITAEYSFTYRIFELSKLPLLIIGPVLLTRFSKFFASGGTLHEKQAREIHLFFRLEMFVALLIPMVLVCTWSPLMDFVTNNKYGLVNEYTYTILAICVPLHYMLNFLWTLAFAQGQLKTLMFITIGSSLGNILLNLILIPSLGGQGSAFAFMGATALQLLLYFIFIKQSAFRPHTGVFILAVINGAAAVVMSKFLFNNCALTALAAIASYSILALVTGLIKPGHLKELRH